MLRATVILLYTWCLGCPLSKHPSSKKKIDNNCFRLVARFGFSVP